MDAHRVAGIGLKLALAVALIAGISAGCGGPAVDVTIEKVGPRQIEETVMIAGALEATNPSQVIPQVMGTVSQVLAQEGQQVAAGQPLVQLDTSDLQQALLSAKAGLESTMNIASAINSMSSNFSALGSSVSTILARVDAGVANLYNLEKSIIPALPEDQRMAALQIIEGGYQAYQNAKANAPGLPSFGGSGYGTGAQQAASNQAIQNATKDLQAATIKAPTAGTLVKTTSGGFSLESMMGSLMSSFSGMMPSGLNLSALTGLSSSMSGMGMPTSGPLGPGSFVMPGTPIYTVVDLKNMSLVAKVDETDISKVKTGQKANVRLEAFPDMQFKGIVAKVADTSTTNEAGATAFAVVAQLDPSPVDLKIGMTGSGDVAVAMKTDAIVVPVEAVLEKKGKKYVYKVENGVARLTEVKLGLTTEEKVEIVEGVRMGDKVVAKGAEKVKDGQGVK